MTIPEDLTNIQLETQRLILSPIKLEESELLRGLFHDPEAMEYLPWLSRLPVGWTKEEIKERIEQHIENQKNKQKLNFHFYLKQGDEKVFIGCGGLAVLNMKDKLGHVGIILHKQYQSMGIGSELLYLILRYSFEVLKLNLLVFETSVSNQDMKGWLTNVCKSELEGILKERVFFNEVFYDLAVFTLFNRNWESTYKPSILNKLKKYVDIEQL